MRVAVYPGSYDPITNGHINILKRASDLFDKVYFLLAVNPDKESSYSVDERISMMRESTKDMPNVIVDYYGGLTVDYCRKVGAKHIIRGLRAVTDFEYEFQLAAANKFAAPDIEMIFFMANREESFISSSTVNQLAENGVDVSSLVPDCVNKVIKNKQ